MDVGGTSSWMDKVDHVGNIWSRQRLEHAVERRDAAISSFNICSDLIRAPLV